jgi:O-acetyl-ADP-ribose deacetylase (regulator of RNase III)
MLELVDGNLLEAQTDALVNAVNTEGVMGKGIALQFKRKFPEMFESYRRACHAGEVQPGRMHVFEVGEGSQPRYIINFPTKRRWRSATRLEDIDAGLTALIHEVQRLKIRSIAVPALGCGNGGLDWSEVLPRIKGVLGSLQEVKVIVYSPQGPL